MLTVARSSPAGLALAIDPSHVLPPHIDLIDRALVRVAAGEITRLIIEAPVRHGKSVETSHYLPAWFLGTQPDKSVAVLSYSDTFAATWGGKVRATLEEYGPSVFGVQVDPRSRAKDDWSLLGHKGGMVTAGAQGGFTGRGFHLIVYDDPTRNAEQARSPVIQEKIWDTFHSTVSSRLEPGGAIIVMAARWHQNDLIGRIKADPGRWGANPWTVINLPALALENDVLGREEGEALWPERWPREYLEGVRQTHRYWFSALYQQSPTPDEGILFKRDDFKYYGERQDMEGARAHHWVLHRDERDQYYDSGLCPRFQTVDVAASEKKTADYTVVSTWAVTPDSDLLLLKVRRQHFETLQVAQFLKTAADEFERPPMWIETFGAGKVPYLQLSREGYPVRELARAEGTTVDKIARAMPAVFAYERHKVFHPATSAEWLDDYEQELTEFGLGSEHDDQVDTVAYAARVLPGMGGFQEYVFRPQAKPITAGIMSETF